MSASGIVLALKLWIHWKSNALLHLTDILKKTVLPSPHFMTWISNNERLKPAVKTLTNG